VEGSTSAVSNSTEEKLVFLIGPVTLLSFLQN